MKQLIFILLIFQPACVTKNPGEIKALSDMNIDFACPCQMLRDTAKENKQEKDLINRTMIFSCADSIQKDKYIFQILLNKKKQYSDDQTLDSIVSFLNINNIEHERTTILNSKGLVIKYPFARELELFGKKHSYYLIVEGWDSLDAKLERCINSLRID